MVTRLSAIGLVGRSSLSYARTVFRLYNERRVFVPVLSGSAARSLSAIAFSEVIEPAYDSGWFAEQHFPIYTDDIAQVNFTSGTTGTPKGILLTHANLADTTHRLIDAMAMNSSISEYLGVPPSYSFGLARLRACSAVNGRAFIPPNGFDVAEFARMLEAGEVNALSAVPTLLRVLLGRADRFANIEGKLAWLEIGSQEMAPDEKRALRELFPNARIVQHYGLTEASRTTFLNISDAALPALQSVGSPLGKTEVALSPENRIRIRGPHVASEWIDESGRHPLLDADGWLTTNDLGQLIGKSLTFQGRADDLINCSGIKIAPEIAEARLRDRLRTTGGVAFVGIPDPLRGQSVLVAAEHGTCSESDLREEALHVLGSFGLSASSALHVWQLDCLPVTPTGKLQRSKIRQMFQDEFKHTPPGSQEGSAQPTSATSCPTDTTAPRETCHDPDSNLLVAVPSGLGTKIAQDPLDAYATLLARLARKSKVDEQTSFAAVGGDSLNYIEASLIMEEMFGDIPPGWESMSLRELAEHAGTIDVLTKPAVKPSLDTRYIQILRSIAIILVVMTHTATLFVVSSTSADNDPIVYFPLRHVNAVFIVVAGFLFQYLLNGFDYRTYLRVKAQTVIAPYLIVSIPAVALYLIGFKDTATLGAPAWVHGPVAFTIYMLLTGTHLGPLWFIPMIVLIYLLAPLFKAIDQRPVLYWAAPLLLVLSYFVGRSADDSNPVQALIFYLPAYVIGMAACRYRNQLMRVLARWWPLLLLAIFIPDALALKSSPYEAVTLLSKVIFCFGLLGGVGRIARRVPRWFDHIGEMSFGIYFVHGYVVGVLLILIKKFHFVPHGFGEFAAASLAVVAVSVLAVMAVKLVFGGRSRWVIGA